MENRTPNPTEQSRIKAAEKIAVTGSHLQALAKRHQLPFLDYLSSLLVLEAWRVASDEELKTCLALREEGATRRPVLDPANALPVNTVAKDLGSGPINCRKLATDRTRNTRKQSKSGVYLPVKAFDDGV